MQKKNDTKNKKQKTKMATTKTGAAQNAVFFSQPSPTPNSTPLLKKTNVCISRQRSVCRNDFTQYLPHFEAQHSAT